MVPEFIPALPDDAPPVPAEAIALMPLAPTLAPALLVLPAAPWPSRPALAVRGEGSVEQPATRVSANDQEQTLDR